MRRTTIGATFAAVAFLAGCSDDNVGDTSDFIAEVRRDVPGASAYTDDQFRSLASKVCSRGGGSHLIRVLDDHLSQIAPEDRERVAEIALRTACE